MEKLCPKCATGTCVYRNGIMCRAYVCMRDENKSPFDFDALFQNHAAPHPNQGFAGIQDLFGAAGMNFFK